MSTLQTNQFYEPHPNIKGLQFFIQCFATSSQLKSQFVDNQFPPGGNSIIQDKTYHKYSEWQKLEWKRPPEFFKNKQFQIFSKTQAIYTSRIGLGKLISPYDIQQGALGDCYFLASLSSMAQQPQRILDLFITRIVNPWGIYCVKICYDGEWQAITIDDQIPCKYNEPVFTKSTSNELWVLLIEKAYAKLYKNYYNIESGYCREALRDLTGAPTICEMTREDNGQVNQDLIKLLKEAVEKQNNEFIITAGANDEDELTQSKADRLGLVLSHAYSVIGIKEITHRQLGKVTLIKLRNPWAKKEWNGDWSDKSPLWYQELKEQLRIHSMDDGVFYMSIEDFVKYFSDVCFCYYHQDFLYSSFKVDVSDKKHSKYFEIKIQREGLYYLSIVQKSKRNFISESNFQYSASRIFIAKLEGLNKFVFVDSILKRDRDTYIKCYLKPGTYVVQTKVFWTQDITSTYVFSTYGVDQVLINPTIKQKYNGLIEQCLTQLAKQSKCMKHLSKESNILRCQDLETKKGYGYYYIQNNSQKVLDIVVTYIRYQGLKMKKPNKFPQLTLCIPPNTDFIAPMTVDRKGYTLSIQEEYK